MPVGMLPGCVYTGAADPCLQPCRKEPLLKTNGITFQRGRCQVLESRATFDNFTQFTRAASTTRRGRGDVSPPGLTSSALPGKPNTATHPQASDDAVLIPWTSLTCSPDLCRPDLPRALSSRDLRTESPFLKHISLSFVYKSSNPHVTNPVLSIYDSPDIPHKYIKEKII